MVDRNFYQRRHPTSYNEVLDILYNHKMQGEPITILAGGTDLMVKNRSWSNTMPNIDQDILFIGNLPELDYIDQIGSRIHIGAATTLEEIGDHFQTPPLLVDAIKTMASPAIRHSGTLIGNICNASPAGDSLPVVYILDGIVVVESAHQVRHESIEDFIIGPGKIHLNQGEIVKEVVLKTHPFNHQSYRKVGTRKADAIAKVNMAAVAKVEKHKIVDFRMAFGAVGPTIVRRREIEEQIIGCTLSYIQEHTKEILQLYMPHIKPIDDQRSNSKYRQKVALNLLEDFIDQL